MEDIDEKNELLEDISSLCHDEWMSWTKNISNDLNETIELLNNNIQYLKDADFDIERKDQLINDNILLINKFTEKLERWESLWIPYEDLTEEMKEKDRKYARRMLEMK